MNDARNLPGSPRLWRAVRPAIQASASPRFTQALTEITLVYALCTVSVRAFLGWPGSIAILAGLVVLAAVSLSAQQVDRRQTAAIPSSVIALLGLIALSVVWSQYTWASIGGALYTAAFGFLGVYVALSRDLIQIVRGIGNATRWILGVSIALEVMSGILLDTPFPFLDIEAELAAGGPISGLAGTRNSLSFIAALAILSFWIERRTKTVSPGLSAASLTLATASLIFARSPVSLLVLGIVAFAGLVLVGVRRLRARGRTVVQGALLSLAVATAMLSWFLRNSLVEAVDAAADVGTRTELWAIIERWAQIYPAQGWGWVGAWPTQVFPYAAIRAEAGSAPSSGLNAFVDIGLQLGLLGLVCFGATLALALVRAWLVASEQRSTVGVWPVLTLILLTTVSMTESYLLTEGGFLLFVVCAVVAARSRSWRSTSSR